MFFMPPSKEDPEKRIDRLRARYDGLRKIEMSSWYSIFDLFHTAMDISLSEVFRSRLDRRMLQPPEPPSRHAPSAHPGSTPPADASHGTRPKNYFDYSTPQEAHRLRNGEFWFDFAADVGDGFNSTYYVASLLAQPELAPQPAPTDPANTKSDSAPDHGPQTQDKPATPSVLPRGEFLILGGDEVYPSASRENYEQRFCRVYEAAAYTDRPPAADGAKHLYAIPGNHDWYDGLASFMQVFGDERSIGDFRTRQRSSYFAIKLPHGLWIFAIDIGLWGELDRRQVEYFQDLAEHDLKDGDRIILCIAEPDWVKARPNIDNLRDGLFYFERRLADALERAAERDDARQPNAMASHSPERDAAQQDPERQGAEGQTRRARRDVRVILRLAGDLHHYRRHKSLEPWHPTDRDVQNPHFDPHGHRWIQNITAGGGGAFLHPTHDVDSDRRNNLTGTLAKAAEGTVTQFPPGFFKVADNTQPNQPIDEKSTNCVIFRCKKDFPSIPESRRLTRGNLLFGGYNRRFFLSLVVLYGGLLNLGLFLHQLGHSVWTGLLVGLVGLGFVKGCAGYAKSEASGEIGESKQGRQRHIYRKSSLLGRARRLGRIHGIAHTVVFSACLVGLAWFYHRHFTPPDHCIPGVTDCAQGCMKITDSMHALWQRHPSWPGSSLWPHLVAGSCATDVASVVRFLLSAIAALICATASTLVFGLYLYWALNKSSLKLHANGAFAALRIQDYKNFLRLCVTKEGVTVYPIGIRTVPKKWELRDPSEPGPPGPAQTSLFYPVGSDRSRPFYDQLTQTEPGAIPFFIEDPIFIPKDDSRARVPPSGPRSPSPPENGKPSS